MTQDSGRGAVVLKNVQLVNYKADDGIVAVKHGNGRDWWIISRTWNNLNDEFYEFLIDPSGISGPTVIHAGSLAHGNIYWYAFSKSGNKFIGLNSRGLIELFDFDRCSGSISLNSAISPDVTVPPFKYLWGAAISPNEQYLYISRFTDSISTLPTLLLQYDLTASDILSSADTLWTYSSSVVASGALRLAPDNKIYFTCGYNDNVNFPYPYPDSLFNTTNNNLSVINYPDSPGVACGFAPFSFNLGAGRCYWGLPNNPDYELGADTNSMCDTVTSIRDLQSVVEKEMLHMFYHPQWEIAFINAEGLRGKKYSLGVFDLMGRKIYKEEGALSSSYFTKDLRCGEFAGGLYVVTLRTEKEVLSKKFVKE
jgi:hypothetical protein